jgi:hypothetical protein
MKVDRLPVRSKGSQLETAIFKSSRYISHMRRLETVKAIEQTNSTIGHGYTLDKKKDRESFW